MFSVVSVKARWAFRGPGHQDNYTANVQRRLHHFIAGMRSANDSQPRYLSDYIHHTDCNWQLDRRDQSVRGRGTELLANWTETIHKKYAFNDKQLIL